MSQCRSCKAAIAWIELPSGKRHPIDVGGARETGTIAVDPDGIHGRVLTKEDLAAHRETGSQLFTSHFSSCPNAARHRR